MTCRKSALILVTLLAALRFPLAYGLPEPGSLAARVLPFHLHARGENKDGSTPVYKDPTADIEDRVNDLLPRMTIEEKVAQMYVHFMLHVLENHLISVFTRIQGDMDGWMNFTDPLDDTLTYNASGLVEMMSSKAGSIWGGYETPWNKFVFGVEVGQRYLMENTTLGIPALFQSEGTYLRHNYLR